MSEIEQLMATCETAARAGARELMDWRGRFVTREKSARDLVTDADLASQQAIRAVIQDQFPQHGFLGEEDPDLDQLNEPYCWVVDPLDGTTNYVHDFPFFCVSVAISKGGTLVAGAVLDPLREECFLAGEGRGSWLNGREIAPSTTTALDQALLAVSFPPDPHSKGPDIQTFLQVTPLCQAVRRTGSAALNLAYVACGRLDAHWAHSIYPWDSAAGILLVREAGGVATASGGGEFKLKNGNYSVASTRQLHESLLPVIQKGLGGAER